MDINQIRNDVMAALATIEDYDPQKHLCWIEFYEKGYTKAQARYAVNAVAHRQHLQQCKVKYGPINRVYTAYKLKT